MGYVHLYQTPPTISKDQKSVSKRVDALRRLHVSKKYSELERERARVSSQRRDLHSKCEKERERKLHQFQERMEKHQKDHRARVEAERLRELERLATLRRSDRESTSTWCSSTKRENCNHFTLPMFSITSQEYDTLRSLIPQETHSKIHARIQTR